MAEESQDGQEKTEDPSQRKIDKSKEDGQILQSKEMFVFTSIAMGMLIFLFIPEFAVPGMKEWGKLFQIESKEQLSSLAFTRLYQVFQIIIIIALFIGIPLMIVSLLTQLAVGGINFAPKAAAFKGSKINPIKGLKRIFSVKGLVELGKSVLKVVLLVGLAALIIYLMLPQLLQISHGSLKSALEVMYYAFPFLIGALLTALAIIAAIDYFWQRHVHVQQLKMTKQELKDENKQTEGSPEVKAKIRRMQMEKSRESGKQREALDNVSNATAVITNPTHFAVALKYNPGEVGAPTILAMGQGIIAQQIIKRANEHKVTVFRSQLLARALYFTGEIGQEISDRLYNAVAVALAYIYRIDQGEPVEEPDITIPDELTFDEFGNVES
ncbi:MAG: flagellar biosynthesis protein FlhB [Alphaproteobacteria bacterium]|nr:flagellar biosynthesis protein FlhB [Alphaproteobacteria bacterium]